MKIAIAGYGTEGEANYRYFRHRGELTIVDEREDLTQILPNGVSTILGEGAFERLEGFDMVVRTAGLAPHKISTDGTIWSATNEFFAVCQAPIIGVTGTKGKGTTCSLIASILRAAGKTVHLVGNIGVPALDTLPNIAPEDIVVYELSSFQLWDIEKSPHVAVVLMIEADHMDVHASMEEYIAAKANIRRHQEADGICLYHPTNEYAQRIATADVDGNSANIGPAYRYGIEDDGQVYVDDTTFCVQARTICSTSTLKLPGRHNIENACAAMSAVLALEPQVDNETFIQGIASFTGLPHRLKFVREVAGVKWYDDSIATTPGSAIAALRSFDEPLMIILGGSDKGAVYDSVIAEARARSAHVVAIGQTGVKIAEAARQQNVRVTYCEGLMETVVPMIARSVKKGSVVILSPASASFDQYKSYADRGEQFVKAVNMLSESTE